jgi:Uma2 family endonuclease
VRVDEFKHPDKPLRPVMVIEILSPSTRRVDLTLKRSRYEAAGCPSYWAVDPDEPSVTAWELVDGLYAEAGHATGEDSLPLAAPFDVTITPARLLA